MDKFLPLPATGSFPLVPSGIAEAKSATYCFKSQPGWQHSGIAKIQYVFMTKNHGQVIEPNGKTCKEQKAEISLVFLRVKEGDTLYSLSKHGVCRAVKIINKLNGFKIVPGQILRIPICWKLTPMPKPQPKPQPWPQPKPEPESRNQNQFPNYNLNLNHNLNRNRNRSLNPSLNPSLNRSRNRNRYRG